MTIIKGYRLLVQLSASQVRKRLKGLGFGVRKVESAGRGQAVVIHTATGQHLQELLAIFQDVIDSSAVQVEEVDELEVEKRGASLATRRASLRHELDGENRLG